MPEWSRKTWQSLFVPGGILLAGVALLDYVGWLNLTLPALSFLYYCGLAGGMLLAWRFHSSRIFFALCVLFLSGQAISLFGGTQPSLTPSGVAAVDAIAVLLPLNYILIALMQERGFTTGSAGPTAPVPFRGVRHRRNSLPQRGNVDGNLPSETFGGNDPAAELHAIVACWRQSCFS